MVKRNHSFTHIPPNPPTICADYVRVSEGWGNSLHQTKRILFKLKTHAAWKFCKHHNCAHIITVSEFMTMGETLKKNLIDDPKNLWALTDVRSCVRVSVLTTINGGNVEVTLSLQWHVHKMMCKNYAFLFKLTGTDHSDPILSYLLYSIMK